MTLKLRPIAVSDLPTIAFYDFTVSISQSLTDLHALQERFDATAFWANDAGARAIEVNGELVGTCQFYRSGPCIHGYELGYIVHDPSNRGRGYAATALDQFTDLILTNRPHCYRRGGSSRGVRPSATVYFTSASACLAAAARE